MSNQLLTVCQAIAFIVGYVLQDIYLTLLVGLGGTVLTFLVVVPPWPYFNKNPLDWLPAGSATSGVGIEVEGKKIN